MISRENFEKLLMDPVASLKDKSQDEIRELFNEDVSKMVGFDQRNQHHCYNLFMHSLHTVEGIPDTSPVLLRVAAFFHDVGKPYVAMEKQGRLVFYGHSKKSAEIAAPLLAELGYTPAEIEEICFYIAHHDDFISWVLPDEKYNKNNKFLVPITSENLRKHIAKVAKRSAGSELHLQRDNWQMLLQLCYADASAQAEIVIRNGVVIDSKEHKQRKIRALEECLEQVTLRASYSRD